MAEREFQGHHTIQAYYKSGIIPQNTTGFMILSYYYTIGHTYFDVVKYS
jgi:hypothetical protein